MLTVQDRIDCLPHSIESIRYVLLLVPVVQMRHLHCGPRSIGRQAGLCWANSRRRQLAPFVLAIADVGVWRELEVPGARERAKDVRV